MEVIFEKLTDFKENVWAFFKWVLLACLVGIIVGGVGTLFRFCVEWATQTRLSHTWLVPFLPLGGVAIVFLYHICGFKKDPGTDLILLAVRSSEEVSIKMTPLIFASTVITHIFGGSAGREGAALQLGGSLGNQIGHIVHLDEKDMHVITMCGMSAGFSALFGTPLASAVFSMEVVSVGVMYYAALVPCTLAAIIGYGVSRFFGFPPTAFLIKTIPHVTVIAILQTLGLGVLCAVVSILVCSAFHQSSKLYRRFLPQAYIRTIVGGVLVVVLALIFQTGDYLGAGMQVIQKAIVGGQAKPEAFILKILFTAVTLGAGYKGGEIVPAFFIGATFGNVAGAMLGLPPEFGAALGLVAVFCGVTNCPMASFILSMELFGYKAPLFFMVAIAASYMLSGYYGLYSKQKILYSKTKPIFIDTTSK